MSWLDQVEVSIRFTFLDFRLKNAGGATEKLLRSQSEGSFGSLRSDSSDYDDAEKSGYFSHKLDAERSCQAVSNRPKMAGASTMHIQPKGSCETKLTQTSQKKESPTNSKKHACKGSPESHKPSGGYPRQQKQIVNQDSLSVSNFTGAICQLVQMNLSMSDAARKLSHFAGCVPPLCDFTNSELASMMWGLSKLADKYHSCFAVAEQMLIPCLKAAQLRLDDFWAQHLATGFYSMAIYRQAARARGTPAADSFALACAVQLSSAQCQQQLQPQGVANALWAAARMTFLGPECAANLCIAAAEAVLEVPGKLKEFQPMELSMMLWAIAKIFRYYKQPANVDSRIMDFAIAAVEQATETAHDQAPQGLSNVAWAVVNLKLHKRLEGQKFLLAAAFSATQRMTSFSPQAVSNLCSAVSNLGEDHKFKVRSFLEMAVRHASSQQFQWHDLAEIITAISKDAVERPIMLRFAENVCEQAGHGDAQMQRQTLVSIGYAGVKIGVHPKLLRNVGNRIAKYPLKNLTSIERRQFHELKAYCRSSFKESQ